MALTKKRFEKAAGIVRDMRGGALDADAAMAAFVSLFRTENPRFDVDRFCGACQVLKAVTGGKRAA